MKALTRKQLARMQWARKAVTMDGTTRDGFRWPVGVGGWVEQDGPANGKACGVGLHLGLTVAGLSSAHRLTESILLAVGWLDEDVLGQDECKIRVRRCWVLPGVTAGLPQVLRDGWGQGADLSRANLAGAYLADANLTYANLTDANLVGANLTYANLTGTNLTDAYLTGAYLTDANLTYANLTDANLTDAYLTYANLTGTNLTDAYLAGAYLAGANLADARVAWGPCDRPSWLPAEWTVSDDGLIVRAVQP